MSRKSIFQKILRCCKFSFKFLYLLSFWEAILVMISLSLLTFLIVDSQMQNRKLLQFLKSVEKQDEKIPADGNFLEETDDINWNYLETKTDSEFTSVCDLLNASRMRYKNITITRLLGPSLPPLQSPIQQSYNLEHILKYENEVHRSKECIRQIWVIACMYNRTEEDEIVQILNKFNQEFYYFNDCSRTNKTKLLNQIKDVNSVRNFAISKALEVSTDWILPLDGNIFITLDALDKIIHGLILDDSFGYQIHTIPLFRIIGCQRVKFKDSFRFDKELETSRATVKSKYPVISEFLSFKQEGQIAVSTLFPDILEFFDPSEKYSLKSKLGLINRLKTNNPNLRCGYNAGNEFTDRSMSKMLYYANNCGYTLRLLYWPEKDSCPFDEVPPLHGVYAEQEYISQQVKMLRNRTEVSNKVRARQRNKGLENLERLLQSDQEIKK